MIHSRLLSLKCFAYAIAALLLLVGAAEMVLRVHDSFTERGFRGGESKLVIRSWQTHHELAPLHTSVQRNPDTGRSHSLTTNSLGLRGSEIAVPKPPGVIRIVCLGDECVLAPGVQTQDTFCARLEELLQTQTHLKVEVINAGVPAYCPLLSYLQVRHRLLSIQPDVLVLNFDMSDIADDYRYRRHTQTDQAGLPLVCPHPDFRDSSPEKASHLSDYFLLPDWTMRHLGSLWRASLATDSGRDISHPQGRYAWLEDQPPDWSIYIQQALSPIGDLNTLADGNNVRLFLAAYPTLSQVSATISPNSEDQERTGVHSRIIYRSRRPFRILAEYAREQNIPFCDTSPAFQGTNSPDKLYLRSAPRFSQSGHEVYARELARFLVRNVRGMWTKQPMRQRPSQISRMRRSLRH